MKIDYEKPLTIAIMAMGGQGGGVLADWIVALAEAQGWYAQSTSVPGVAQRTGATLYYIEMLPPRDGKAPVLALMPTPGDVNVVIAAELMEAGRSILRGLATPDRTVLITSTHRAYAVSEKEKPAEGIADPRAVNAAAGIAAKRIVSFDMEAVAKACGTVVSSPIFGALAGTGLLPFARAEFEKIISAGGKGVAASLKGFAAGYDRASSHELPDARSKPEVMASTLPLSLGSEKLDRELNRIEALPTPVQVLALAGFKRCVDFMDLRYGRDYLTRVEKLFALDQKVGGAAHDFEFTATAAKYLANAFAYDDVISVADLKTRSARFQRIAKDMDVNEAEPIYFTEFMHPRAEEVIGMMPVRLGNWVTSKPKLVSWIDRRFNRSRKVETATIWGFLQLYAVSALRPWRRSLLRHAQEMAHLENWLTLATSYLDRNYGMARGLLSARRLVKGYSDTHVRGLSKYDRVVSAAPLLATRDDAGTWMDRLISIALKDEEGKDLSGALETIKSL
jgi:indolepyruvate ferredoxin oxidoreductase, beta subunit